MMGEKKPALKIALALGKPKASAMDEEPEEAEEEASAEEVSAMKLFEKAGSSEEKASALKLFLKACGVY